MNEPELMTTDDIAVWLRVSRYSIYRYLKQGVPNDRLGVKHLFKRAERPNGARRERGLAVGEAVAKLKSFVPGRGR